MFITIVNKCYYTCDLYYICDQLLHLCLQWLMLTSQALGISLGTAPSIALFYAKLISSVHYRFTLLPSIHQLLSEGKCTRCSTTVSSDRFSVFNKVRSFNSKGKEYTQLPFRFANYLFNNWSRSFATWPGIYGLELPLPMWWTELQTKH